MLNKTDQIGFRVQPGLKEKLKKQARMERCSLSKLVTAIATEYIAAKAVEARPKASNGHSHRIVEPAS